jgi:hypothetical protein
MIHSWGLPPQKRRDRGRTEALSFERVEAMRKTEAACLMLPGTLRRAARLSAIALGVGVLFASNAARAGDDEDEPTFEEKIITGIMRGLGGINMDNSGIDYRERSPLVVPPKLDLPPPASATAEVKVPNWPKDPDEARRKALIAARKKDAHKDTDQLSRDASRLLTADELNKGRTAASNGGTAVSDSTQPGGVGGNPTLSASQLGYDGGLFKMFKGNTSESAPFKGEPTRETLTMPPPGYQTPSPNFAYGTGPRESLNKEYNPAAGKYGE